LTYRYKEIISFRYLRFSRNTCGYYRERRSAKSRNKELPKTGIKKEETDENSVLPFSVPLTELFSEPFPRDLDLIWGVEISDQFSILTN